MLSRAVSGLFDLIIVTPGLLDVVILVGLVAVVQMAILGAWSGHRAPVVSRSRRVDDVVCMCGAGAVMHVLVLVFLRNG